MNKKTLVKETKKSFYSSDFIITWVKKERFKSFKQAAKELGISYETILNWKKNGSSTFSQYVIRYYDNKADDFLTYKIK